PSVAGLTDRIQERAGGNPFFTEELVQGLVETGSLEGTRGAYRLRTPAETLALPASVQTVLAARIDRLPEREKRVLQTAAVIGKEFAEPVLRRVEPLPEAELAAALRALAQAELVYETALYPQAEYAFKHPLTQEVAYGSQLGERRRQVHAPVARTRMLHNTIFLGDLGVEASVLFAEGMELAARLEDPAPRVILLVEYGAARVSAGAMDEGLARLSEGVALADRSGDPFLRFM